MPPHFCANPECPHHRVLTDAQTLYIEEPGGVRRRLTRSTLAYRNGPELKVCSICAAAIRLMERGGSPLVEWQ